VSKAGVTPVAKSCLTATGDTDRIGFITYQASVFQRNIGIFSSGTVPADYLVSNTRTVCKAI